MTENIVTGRLYRILADKANEVWDRLSFWKKASDVEFDNGTNLENNRPIGLLRRDKVYSPGDVAYTSAIPSWGMLKCIVGGRTKSTLPSGYADVSFAGATVVDGGATFCVYDIRPSSTLSDSEYQIPTLNLVSMIDSQLTANDKKFYFAYENGTYGYRAGSDGAFVPFK